MAFLIGRRIVRPGYSTLQTMIGDALSAERQRLEQRVEETLDDAGRAAMEKLLVRENALSELAAIKQDARNFRYKMMVAERQKRTTLTPLYVIAKALLPSLGLSQLNIAYYASLVDYYTIYDLRRLKSGPCHLYLLCYAWQRYRQLSDNLVEALGYHMKRLEDDTKEAAKRQAAQIHAERQQASPRVGQLLLLYVDDTLEDATPFGAVRLQAFRIMPKETLLLTGRLLSDKPVNQLDLRWQAVDKQSGRCTKNLRPLAMSLDFDSSVAESPWLEALRWMKSVFGRQQSLARGRSMRFQNTRFRSACARICCTSTRMAMRLACKASATSSGYIGNCANASTLATSTWTTAFNTGALPMSWSLWTGRRRRSRH